MSIKLFVQHDQRYHVLTCSSEDSFETPLSQLFPADALKSIQLSVKDALSGFVFGNVKPSQQVGLFVSDVADVSLSEALPISPSTTVPSQPIKVAKPKPKVDHYPAESELRHFVEDAQVHFEKSNYKDAVELLKTAIEIRPVFYDALVLLGDCFSACNMFLEAANAYNSALSIRSDPVVRIKAGKAFESAGKIDEALEHFSAASRENPKTEFEAVKDGRAGIGRCLISKKEYQRALAVVSTTLQVTESHVDSLLVYAAVLEHNKDIKEATKALVKAITLQGGVSVAPVFGKFLKAHPDALSTATDMFTTGPTADISLKLIAQMLSDAGYYGPAQGFLKKLVRKNTDNTVFIYDYMKVLEKDGKYLDAVTELCRYCAAVDGKTIHNYPVRDLRRVLDDVLALKGVKVPTDCVYGPASPFSTVFDRSAIDQRLSKLDSNDRQYSSHHDHYAPVLLMVAIRLLYSLGALSIIHRLSSVVNEWIVNSSNIFKDEPGNVELRSCLKVLKYLVERESLPTTQLNPSNRLIVVGSGKVLKYSFKATLNDMTTVPCPFSSFSLAELSNPTSPTRFDFVRIAGAISAKSNVVLLVDSKDCRFYVDSAVQCLKHGSREDAIHHLASILATNMSVLSVKRKSVVSGAMIVTSTQDVDFVLEFNKILAEKLAIVTGELSVFDITTIQ
ncbi:hypothetical protein RCL1_003005 [Eukaryota sp. TZLM3-RCL]